MIGSGAGWRPKARASPLPRKADEPQRHQAARCAAAWITLLANRPRQFRPGHVRPRAEANREYDRHRGSARERGYTSAWDKAAKAHLQQQPLCVYCQLVEVVRVATCVDHLYPQRQFPGTFWRSEWWCSSCKECHDGFKQSVERRGRAALDALAQRLGLPLLG